MLIDAGNCGEILELLEYRIELNSCNYRIKGEVESP